MITTTTPKGGGKDQEEQRNVGTSKQPPYHRFWKKRTRGPLNIRFWFIDTCRSPQVLTQFKSHFMLVFSEAAEGLTGIESN